MVGIETDWVTARIQHTHTHLHTCTFKYNYIGTYTLFRHVDLSMMSISKLHYRLLIGLTHTQSNTDHAKYQTLFYQIL